MKDMLGREEVIPLEKAKELLSGAVMFRGRTERETVIEISSGLVASRDIVSSEDLPGFSRSTMDGFAVRSEDTFGVSEGMPAYLNLSGEVLMGEKPAFRIKKAEAARISTGGMLPEGADAVVMFEHSNVVDDRLIEVLRPVALGENVIQAGEDCRKGEVILRKGHRIRPHDTGILAGTGITKVWTYEKPVVSIISTGDELVPPSSPLKTGQVRDINSYTLSGLIEKHGGTALRKGIFPDTYGLLSRAAGEALRESDIVVITGGSSVGTSDLTERLINASGKPGVLFHGVSIKPGKPVIAGVADNKPMFGLPGHPAAVIVCFDLFIRPVMTRLGGETERLPHTLRNTVRAKLARSISSSPGREDYVRVLLEEKNGELLASPLLGKSGLIATLVKADGTIVIPLWKSGLEQGTVVDVELFS